MPPKLKLTYFNIEGVAERIRLALKIGGIAFEDERIDFAQWSTMKPTTPYGVLPMLSIDDAAPITQSGAILRYVGQLAGLYPKDPLKALKVEEVLGLQDDLSRAVYPSSIILRTPQAFGYAADLAEAERKTIQSKLRTALASEGGDIPRYLGYFDAILKKNGTGYFVGDALTIADCSIFALVRLYKNGVYDGVSPTIVNDYPNITTFYEKMMALPAVSAHYAK